MNLLPGDQLLGGAHTIGLRPEDVTLDERGELEMTVVLREPLGAQQLLTLRKDALELRALVPVSAQVQGGVRVRIDAARVHGFDASGRRIP